MAGGIWSESDKPIRPGFYNVFESAALDRAKPGKKGVVALPVTSNWGPVGEVVSVKSEKELIEKFGESNDFTAYKLGRLTLLGEPRELLLYRMTDGKEKNSELILKAGEQEVIKLESKYPTTRDFRISVVPNILDEEAIDINLLEGALPIYSFKKLEGTAEEVAETINKNAENKWLLATALEKDSEEQIKLEPIVSVAMTGGNDGIGEISVDRYVEAMTAFEGKNINAFSLDGKSTPALQKTVTVWVERNRKAGKKIRAYLGGPKDEILSDAIEQSKELDSPGVAYLGVTGGIFNGVEYSPAETACYIMGLSEGQNIKDSLTNELTVFQGITQTLGHEDYNESIKHGVLVLRENNGEVYIEDDVNTYRSFTKKEDGRWGYIRAIKFLDMVDEDTSLEGNTKYVGKALNITDGQLAVISALKKYFEELHGEGIILDDFVVAIDEERQANAADDEFFWIWDAKYVNVMKRLYGTGHIR